MKRVEIEADQMPGQDSFLDVITNIVGILILLVLVVGLRTSRSVQEASADAPSEHQQAFRSAYNAALEAEKGVQTLIHRVGNARQELLLRNQERVWLSTVVAEAEEEIAAQRATLNTEDQRDFDLRQKLIEAQTILEELNREQIALLAQEPETEEIECEPTPIGKVVTGKEIHILLANDHVAVVPFDELLEMMKEDVTANIWRLREQDELERTIGPVNGFRLRYWFVKAAVVARSEAGNVVTGAYPQFSRCSFLPETDPIGEPAEEAMAASSGFTQFLQRVRPETTVTIWTYPGNFDRLRELKRIVREYGLQIAVRPLPPGMPIGASRNGSESVSE